MRLAYNVVLTIENFYIQIYSCEFLVTKRQEWYMSKSFPGILFVFLESALAQQMLILKFVESQIIGMQKTVQRITQTIVDTNAQLYYV